MERNAERINRVAEAILKHENDWGFNMNTWLSVDSEYSSQQIYDSQLLRGKRPKDNCGTTMCIAGWACALYPEIHRPKQDEVGNIIGFTTRASYILGLTARDGYILFTSINSIKTPEQAYRCLRLMAKGANVEIAIEASKTKVDYESEMEKLTVN